MYSKKAEWSRSVAHVVLEVGSNELPASQLIRYSLDTPGIHTAIIGIGKISEDPSQCQLSYNLKHAQIKAGELGEAQRKDIERLAVRAKEGKTNYFQKSYQDLTPPREVTIARNEKGAVISWHTAYAGDAAIDRYEIWKDGAKLASIPFKPQTSKMPYQFVDKRAGEAAGSYVVKVIDKNNRIAEAMV
jgi:hypothetical protein